MGIRLACCSVLLSLSFAASMYSSHNNTSLVHRHKAEKNIDVALQWWRKTRVEETKKFVKKEWHGRYVACCKPFHECAQGRRCPCDTTDSRTLLHTLCLMYLPTNTPVKVQEMAQWGCRGGRVGRLRHLRPRPATRAARKCAQQSAVSRRPEKERVETTRSVRRRACIRLASGKQRKHVCHPTISERVYVVDRITAVAYGCGWILRNPPVSQSFILVGAGRNVHTAWLSHASVVTYYYCKLPNAKRMG